MAEPPKLIHRREFIRVASLAVAAFSGACGPSSPSGDAAADGTNNDAALDTMGTDAPSDASTMAGLPTLGGAPNTPQGRTIAAFVDTVMPGRWRDPMNQPGGLDADVPALFYDPTLPAAPVVPLLVAALDGISRELYEGRTFERLTPAERDRVVETGLTRASQLDFAVTLVKLGFYSSEVAGDYLGYPGANPGYINDADFSFNRPMAREIMPPGGNPA